ncbi:MAG TPA: thioesterase family protein [Thermoguttaceae bacterium]|nr:thioesterase family protein [Thermoguttaceae bacterium]
MSELSHVVRFRVRYSDTDQMMTYYNARVLEWFELGRNELIRALGKPYRQWEAEGVRLPVCEAHIEFDGPAQYDDLLRLATTLVMPSRARVRFDSRILHDATGTAVCHGYTVHAVVDTTGRPIRPPAWMTALVGRE